MNTRRTIIANVCTKCDKEILLDPNGKCKGCHNKYQREYRKRVSNKDTKTYEKTPKGYLVRTYRNMLSRVKGILKKKAHLYKGLEILSKEDFYKWSMESNYCKLLLNYEESGYDMKFAPSIDRIDPLEGYSLGNIRWVTHSENSSNTRHKKIKVEKI